MCFQKWLKTPPDPNFNPPPLEKFVHKIKNPEVPILQSYDKNPGSEFWSSFPFASIPKKISENRHIDPYVFQRKCQELKLGPRYTSLADNACHSLFFGANLNLQRDKIKSLNETNDKELFATLPGSIFTDTLISGIKSGFYAGPYPHPVSNYNPDCHLTLSDVCKYSESKIKLFDIKVTRINRVFLIQQPNKYRFITHLSYPQQGSFNEMVDKSKLRKLNMSTPSQLAQQIRIFDGTARISKLDLRSAYQQVPLKCSDIPLLAFKWLDRYFYNLRLTFGANNSPDLFDTVNAVNTQISIVNSKYNSLRVHRVLDDMICIDSYNTDSQNFINTFIENCEDMNISLAELKDEKAFLFRLKGEVLGITLDARNSTWSLSEKKVSKILNILYNIRRQTYVNLHDLQVTIGILNIFQIMSPPLRAIRSHLIQDLKTAHKYENIILSEAAKCQLDIWINIVSDIKYGFPIHNLLNNPPIGTTIIGCDAAGCSADFLINTIGAGAAMNKNNEIHIFQADFPPDLVTVIKDINNKRFGNKTTVLELCAIILPLYHCIVEYMGRNLIIHTDNYGAVWGWKKGRLKNCQYASCLIEALMIISVNFSVNLHIKHQLRCSTHLTIYADNLTRQDLRSDTTKKKFQKNLKTGFPPSLLTWLQNPPTYDTMLGLNIVNDILNNIKK